MTQISLGIRPVWSESSLCAQRVAKDPSFLHADSENSYQTGRMPRLIWDFAGRTCHFVGFGREAAQIKTSRQIGFWNKGPVCNKCLHSLDPGKQNQLCVTTEIPIWKHNEYIIHEFYLCFMDRKYILSVNEKLKNLKFRYFENYKKESGVDFTKGFKTWHRFITKIRFMLISIIVLLIAHEFITGNLLHNR